MHLQMAQYIWLKRFSSPVGWLFLPGSRSPPALALPSISSTLLLVLSGSRLGDMNLIAMTLCIYDARRCNSQNVHFAGNEGPSSKSECIIDTHGHYSTKSLLLCEPEKENC